MWTVNKMCDICGQTPCNTRCPNAEIKIIGNCAYCTDEIESENVSYTDNIGNMFCCEECAKEYYGIKEND